MTASGEQTPKGPVTHVLSEAQHSWLAEQVMATQQAQAELQRRGGIIRQELSEKYGVPVEGFAPNFRLDDAAQRFVLDELPEAG